MKLLRTLPLAALLLVTGCAQTVVSSRQEYTGGPLPRPKRIVVYNFAASLADIPAWAAGAARYNGAEPQQSPDQLAAGRKLGAEVAQQVAAQIISMGLPAQTGDPSVPLYEGDYAIVGYFESVDKGSTLERVTIGFGAGAASMKTKVEGYRMTASGPEVLGGGEINSGDGKSPGMVVPLAVTLATANPIGLVVGGAIKVGGEVTGHDTIEGVAKRTSEEIGTQLKAAFRRQGWI